MNHVFRFELVTFVKYFYIAFRRVVFVTGSIHSSPFFSLYFLMVCFSFANRSNGLFITDVFHLEIFPGWYPLCVFEYS